MRIIAGKHRGRPLKAPAGLTVRPTGERAREALFDILTHSRFTEGPAYHDAHVLDAFAGTGAFGLEALSRGAAYASFIDQDRAALQALRANIDMLDEEDRSRAVQGDALKPPRADRPCSLIFLDPPYREDVGGAALLALRKAGWVAPAALAVVEIAAKQDLATPEGFELLDKRRYGAAKLLFFRAP